jgi:hypothetical protein
MTKAPAKNKSFRMKISQLQIAKPKVFVRWGRPAIILAEKGGIGNGFCR